MIRFKDNLIKVKNIMYLSRILKLYFNKIILPKIS